MEKPKGIPLGGIWYNLQEDSQKKIVAQLVDLETRLRSIAFTRHGCIFSKKDLEDKGVRSYDLKDLDPTILSYEDLTKRHLINKYAVGPSTEAKLW